MNRRDTIIALILCGLVLVAAATAWFLRPQSPPLPSPNGYDDLISAGQAIARRNDDFLTLDYQKLRGIVETNAASLRLIRLGLSRRCAVPTDAGHVTDRLRLNYSTQLLLADGRLREMDGRPADAAKSYIDAVRLGSETSRGGVIINRMVGIDCETVGEAPLIKLVPKLGCEQIQLLVADLEQINDNQVPWEEIKQNERRLARARFLKRPNPLEFFSGFRRAQSVAKPSERKHALAAARLRLIVGELAIRSYRCEQGRLPNSLDQLVPKYLQSVPSDPFSGRRLVYHPQGTNWLLYSVGLDLIDNGGKRARIRTAPSSPNAGFDLFYDSPW